MYQEKYLFSVQKNVLPMVVALNIFLLWPQVRPAYTALSGLLGTFTQYVVVLRVHTLNKYYIITERAFLFVNQEAA